MSDKHISKDSLFSSQDHGRLSGVCMWRVWCVCVVVCTCGVVCGVGGVCMLLCCGGACVWCVVKLGTLSLSCSLSFHFSFPFAFLLFFFSLYFSLFFFFFFFSCSFSYFCSCSCSFSFSSLFSSRHQTLWKNRSTNTAANIEAFECDLAQGKCTAVGSLPPPLPSLLPSPPSLLKKKKEEYFRRGIFFMTVLN